MFTRMLLPVVPALILCGSLAAESAADTAEKQQWKVQLAGDSAVVQIAEGTEHKFVRATITALRDAGSEKISLRVLVPNSDAAETKLTYWVKIMDGAAKILASADLPYKHLTTIIDQLKKAGVTEIKLVVRG